MQYIFFDIECVSVYTKEERETKTHNVGENDRTAYELLQEKYPDTLGFMPEHNKILCLSYIVLEAGKIYESGVEAVNGAKQGTFYGNEHNIIMDFYGLFLNPDGTMKEHTKFIGYNIKNFDVPFLVKRGIINSIDCPDVFKAIDRKPREWTHIVDLYNIRKLMGMSSCNLDTLCKALKITSPKEEGIEGSMVQKFHDMEQDKDIVEYCERDTITLVRLFVRFYNLNLL